MHDCIFTCMELHNSLTVDIILGLSFCPLILCFRSFPFWWYAFYCSNLALEFPPAFFVDLHRSSRVFLGGSANQTLPTADSLPVMARFFDPLLQ